MNTETTVIRSGALLIAGVLAGCGGGGGSGGRAFFPLSPTTIETPVVAATPAPAPAPTPVVDAAPPTPAPAPAPVPDPVAYDSTACITAPQAGSTADVGNEFEGVWYQTVANINNGYGLMQIDASGDMRGFNVGSSAPAGDSFYGAMAFSAPNGSWQVTSGMARPSTGAAWSPFSGSGAYTAKRDLNGNYAVGTAAQSPFGPWTYNIANSLAVRSSVLEGAWGGFMVALVGSINVAADGTYIGSTPTTSLYGTCKLSGTLGVAEVGGVKNNLALTLAATDAAQGSDVHCRLPAASTGKGVVNVFQDTTNGVCTRSMTLYFFLNDPVTGKPSGSTIAFPK